MSTTNPICARVKSRLPEYVSGALTRSEKREIDSHLTECSDCRKLFAEIGAVVHDDHVPSHNHSRRPTPKIRSHERLHPVMLLNSSRHVVAGVLVAFLVMLTAVITIIRSGIDSPNEKQQGYIDAITKANEARLDERSPRQPPPARLRAQPAAQPPPQQPIGAAQPSASPPALAHNQSSSPRPAAAQPISREQLPDGHRRPGREPPVCFANSSAASSEAIRTHEHRGCHGKAEPARHALPDSIASPSLGGRLGTCNPGKPIRSTTDNSPRRAGNGPPKSVKQ